METRHCTPNFQFLELHVASYKETKEELRLVLRQEYTNYVAVCMGGDRRTVCLQITRWKPRPWHQPPTVRTCTAMQI